MSRKLSYTRKNTSKTCIKSSLNIFANILVARYIMCLIEKQQINKIYTVEWLQ